MQLRESLNTLVELCILGLWYPRSSTFDLVSYLDMDSVDSLLDRKSTSENYKFLGQCLIFWV